jgi:hypothetical protein
LLRELPDDYHSIIGELVDRDENNGLIKGIEITGGSIGISMARLWKEEVGMVALKGGHYTPWDWAPVVGISKKLGYKFLRPTSSDFLEEFEPEIRPEVYDIDHDIVIVHSKYLSELDQFI